MKKYLSLMAGVLLAATTMSVSAQQAKPAPAKPAPAHPASGFNLGFEGGFANVGEHKNSPGFRTTSDTRNVLFGRLMAGYDLTPNFGLELGYFGSGKFRSAETGGNRRNTTVSAVRGVDALAVYKFTEGLPGLFLKGGVSYASVGGEGSSISPAGRMTVSDSRSGMGYVLGAGYEVKLAPEWSANVAYTRHQRLGGVSNNGMNVITGGVKYHF